MPRFQLETTTCTHREAKQLVPALRLVPARIGCRHDMPPEPVGARSKARRRNSRGTIEERHVIASARTLLAREPLGPASLGGSALLIPGPVASCFWAKKYPGTRHAHPGTMLYCWYTVELVPMAGQAIRGERDCGLAGSLGLAGPGLPWFTR